MKLHYTTRSPYARKVLITAHERGLADALTLVQVDLRNKPASFLEATPLGKIPALELRDGTVIVDSPVICEYLDSIGTTGASLFPSGPERFTHLTFAALGDGLGDSMVGIVLEDMRPEEKRFAGAKEKHMNDINRTLDYIEKHSTVLTQGPLTIAGVAIGGSLGYLDFRATDFPWRTTRPRLAAWYETISKRPSWVATVPSA